MIVLRSGVLYKRREILRICFRMSLANPTDDTVSLITHEEDEQHNVHGKSIVKKRNRTREIRMIVLACIVFGCGITVALVLDIYIGQHYSGHAAVVSDVKECADIGLELLKKGGSGVDAAIGTMLCVGVMNPESTGIGGGGFMLISPPGQDAKVVDFREVAPLGASKDMYHGKRSLAEWGGLAVAVPGEIRGYEEAHKKYGKLQWSEVITPAIKLAKDGFKVTPHTARVLKHFKQNVTGTRLWKLVAPKGTVLKEEDWMRNPALAETLQTIADKGAAAFYEGKIADSIVSAVKSQNGILTQKDLKAYKTVWRETINTTYSGFKIVTTPLPAGGPVLLSILNILEGFNLTRKDQGKALTYHYIIEAFKFAFAERSLLEDPKFGGETVKNITEQMLNKTDAALKRQQISPNKTFPPEHYGPFLYQPKTHGTAHVSVIGPDGELVSVTSTINMYFGSGIMTETGIILNNEMADFNIPGADRAPGVGKPKANFVEPAKRPLSSTVPTVVLHQEDHCWFRLALGGSGGTLITPAVAEVLINNLTFSDPLDKAIERPRVYYVIQTGQVAVEVDKFADANKAKEVVKALKSKGHSVTEKAGLSDVNGLVYHKEQLKAHADSRRGGEGTAQFDA